ncbi:alpha-tocopherol transfer protein-like [Parasteatoda tepidariorum]|uniref:alpha-tocopherol transfer protein-like n=1 Tax=Parasteatoda tepidariorum TaxID=114398 RepID=UPI001C718CFE|nr:alpha-tocopherol transfer protein-like [Parasteatoda tepidariorum]XP_042903202.1 alpha-tocopherol transfer protein-like [Parasteatoda tepidariorum]
MEKELSEEFTKFECDLITEDLRKCAELELHEREDKLSTYLENLKDLLKNEKGLTPCLDESFLLMFLRARKFDCQAANELIKKYYKAPLELPSMFVNFNPHSCMNAINSGIHYFLPYRSPEGCAILLSKFGKWDPNTLTCEELLKFNIMCNEMAIRNPVTQICGTITIADMKDFSWSHLLQIPMNEVRCFINTLQDCLPIRDKAIHIINHSTIFSVLFSLVKPILSEKIKERIYFHGSDLKSLHKHLPPAILPEHLGGNLPNEPNQEFYDLLLNSEDYFIARLNHGYLPQEEVAST